jgi:hypothetical protein
MSDLQEEVKDLGGVRMICVIHRHPFNPMLGKRGFEDEYGSNTETAADPGADV